MKNAKMEINVAMVILEVLATSSKFDEAEVLNAMKVAKKALKIRKSKAFELYKEEIIRQCSSSYEEELVAGCYSIDDIVNVMKKLSEETYLNINNEISWIHEFHR